LSPRSVRYVHTILHRALADAVRWGRLARNPADAADAPRERAAGKRAVEAWSVADLRLLLDASRSSGDRYYAAWVVLATTGARRGEVLGLRWCDVDLEQARASVVQTVVAIRHEVSFGTPKTAAGRRPLSLDAGTVAVLREWRARQAEERLKLGPGYRDHDLVFAKVTGEPLHPERFSREFDRRVERWRLPRLSLHGLRHTWATLALEAGVHPRVVQERLGHSTVAITLQTYSHVAPTLHADAAELVAGRVFGQM
jgi:integrase